MTSGPGTTDSYIKSVFKSEQYHLLEKIGEGGFGQVYKAQERNSDQFVAIKFLVLGSDFDQEKRERYLDRFERESILCGRLNHPNIVKLLNKGYCDENVIYAVYEFVDGLSLKELLRSEKLDAVEVADLMAQVLDAMIHAHQQGVIHRDLKPANIMLMQSGAKRHVKILDFGIGALTKDARQVDYRTLTLTQETLGTPSYSAPEQLRGELASFSSDLYVWGLVFIECLTRKPAVTGSSLASVFHKQLASENIPLPISIVGHPIASLLRRVLQKNVKERASKAADVYAELNRLNMASLVIKDDGNSEAVVSTTDDGVFEATQIINTDVSYTHLTERKQISVLCMSIQAVKHEENIEREFIETLVRDLRNQCADLAIGYSGQIAGTLGNCLVIFFGYPVSTGNDGRLTARASLEIAGLIHRRNANLKDAHGFSIQYQMAIHTGPVTCYSESMPEGETVSKTLQMLQYTGVNEILCSEQARTVLSNFIEIDLGSKRTISLGIECDSFYPVQGERRAEALGFIRGNKVSAEMYGRDHELRWIQSRLSNKGQRYAHIQGDAGVGKSRLAYEIRNRFASSNQHIAQCYPEQMFNGLFPILSLIKSIYFLEPENEKECRSFIERTLIKSGIEDKSVILQVLIWLEVSLTEDEVQGQITGPIDDATLFSALTSLLTMTGLEDGNSKPAESTQLILLVVEDLHWADDKTLSFLKSFIETSDFSCVQLLTTSRNSMDYEGFEDKQIKLKGLELPSIKKLISKQLGNAPVSEAVIDFVVERTDGVPLYIEEMVSMLIAKEYVQKINGLYDFIDLTSAQEIPATILDVLHHKLDNLDEAKVTAQLASLIGREFDWDMLMSVSRKSTESLQSDLELMTQNEVIYRQRRVDGDRYIFKHVLIRDVAEESASKMFKMANHQAFAEYYEQTQNLEQEGHLNSIIHHLDGCENYESAIKYCQTLIGKSLAKGAFHQAYEISCKAVEYAKILQLGPQQLVAIYSPLTTSAMMIFGWASIEAEKLVDETQLLMSKLDPHEQSVEFASYWAMAIYLEVRGQHLKAVSFIDMAFERATDPADKSALLALKAHSLWAQGHHDAASHAIAETVSLYEKTDPMVHGPRYGQDSKVFALSVQALIASNEGDIEEAEKWANEAAEQAIAVDSQHSLVMAKVYWCCSLFHVQEREGFYLTLQEAKKISENAKLGNWEGTILVLEGWYENNTQKAESGLEIMLQSGLTEMQGYWNAMIAETEFNNGYNDQALSRIQSMIEHSKTTSEFLFVKMLNQLKERIEVSSREGESLPEEQVEL